MKSNLPENHDKLYRHFMKNGNYRKAYRYLASLLEQSPRDENMLTMIVQLCIYYLKQPSLAWKWLLTLMQFRSCWYDHLLYSRIKAFEGEIPLARDYQRQAWRMYREDSLEDDPSRDDPSKDDPLGGKSIEILFTNTEDYINLRQWETKFIDRVKFKPIVREKKAKKTKARRIPKSASPNKVQPKPKPEKAEKNYTVPVYSIPIKLISPNAEKLESFSAASVSSIKEAKLRLDYNYLNIQRGFDELLCLHTILGVEQYWYQLETVKKVLKYFRGRVLLCDEVGLGKTIEAGMLIKEYCLRGMVKNILILTPPSLVSQWQEEMQSKFGLEFLTTDANEYNEDPEKFWRHKFIIASLNIAKNKKNSPLITRGFYDLVVIDEAHRLRNRITQAWKLVNQIQKKFIFLLTATPVQNNLIELYNLITLLKPGQFKTEKFFKKEYVKRGDHRLPANREKLKELLRDVMIRNTRNVINLKLPSRHATTIQLKPTDEELRVYTWLKGYLREKKLKKNMANLLLRQAGSSPFALQKTLEKFRQTKELEEIITVIETCREISKGKALLNIICKNPQEKTIVFAQYLKSVDYISALLQKHNIAHVNFRGNMTSRAKNKAIVDFKEDVPVLVSTESGGEGRNMQFCRTIVNFDLPWNPMKIEQRIGRLHRIGQTRDVFIFNLAVKETIEEYIIDILDSKINMFEMVIGEIEPILGHISNDDFENIILDIWMQSSSDQEMSDMFAKLGEKLVQAKDEYLKAKNLDEEIFGEDYET